MTPRTRKYIAQIFHPETKISSLSLDKLEIRFALSMHTSTILFIDKLYFVQEYKERSYKNLPLYIL